MTKMARTIQSTSEPSQLDKFKEAARDLEADESEAHWDERLTRVAKAKVPAVPKRIAGN